MSKSSKNSFAAALMIMSIACVGILGVCKPAFCAAKPVTLSFAHVMSENSIAQDIARDVKNYVEKKSNGEIKIDIYPSSSLGGETDYVEGLQAGTIDMALITISVFQNWCSETGLFDIPFIIENFDAASAIWNSDICEPMKKQIRALGMEPYGAAALGARMLTNNVRPVTVPADVKGLTIRTMVANLPVETWELLGANVVSMNVGEVFSALQTGVIDGQENPITAIKSNSFYEVQKYMSLTGHTFSLYILPVSNAVASKLTPKQLAIVKEGVEKAARASGKHLDDRTAEDLKFLEKAGVKVNKINLQAFRDAVKPLYKKYSKVYGNKIDRILKKEY